MQPVAVDDGRRDDPDCNPLRAPGDGPEERFALIVRQLLRVVQQRERPDAVIAQAHVVEENGRRHERPGEASTPRLVRSCDEAHAEPAVEGEQLAARAAHGPEHSD